MGVAVLLVAATTAGAVLHVGSGTPPADAAVLINLNPKPFAGPFTPEIEPYAAYDGQTKCIKKAKPGVVAFERFVLRRYARTSYGITRACNPSSISEHFEGRAIDWHMNAYDPGDRERVKKVFRWLFKTDWWGNTHARARRLGIMYIIWNKRMWRAYRPYDGWQKYEGSSPHTDHVHFSFARAGGNAMTSYWTGKIADLPGAWVPTPNPTPAPSQTPTPWPSPSASPSPTWSPEPWPTVWPTAWPTHRHAG